MGLCPTSDMFVSGCMSLACVFSTDKYRLIFEKGDDRLTAVITPLYLANFSL
jgi:hypothetical protein